MRPVQPPVVIQRFAHLDFQAARRREAAPGVDEQEYVRRPADLADVSRQPVVSVGDDAEDRGVNGIAHPAVDGIRGHSAKECIPAAPLCAAVVH